MAKTATGKVISYIPSNAVGEDNTNHKWARSGNDVDGYQAPPLFGNNVVILCWLVPTHKQYGPIRGSDYKDFGHQQSLFR